MSSISNLKDICENIYMEGIASEHPDISGQPEFAKKADKILSFRKKNRSKNKSPELPSFIKTSKNITKEEFVIEREMTSAEVKREKTLRTKYDSSGMKKSMISQYGAKKGPEVYFGKIRKMAMTNSFEPEGEQLDENPLLGLGLRAGAAALGGYLASKGIEVAKKKVYNAIDKERKTSRIGGERHLNQSFDYDDAYNYIIEMLVSADFAEDYESAEIMFEHISDEFTSAILEEYIEEKARGTRKKTTVHAYDVDETLFSHGKGKKPNVQVHVNDESGKRVQSLSNQEFNTHKLKKGHSYDFSEFQSAKKFKETSTPNKKVVKHIKKKIARGENVHLITARSKFDDPKEFHGHLKKHGINIPMGNIHYTGGMKGKDIGDKKVAVANAIAKKHKASKVHMYDDAAKVHKSFEKEKKQAPATKKIKTHMVAPDNGGESRVRSYQATKTEEMTAYEYWKQFINEENDFEVISEISYAAQRELDALKRIPSNLAKNVAAKAKPNMLMRRELGNLGRASRGLGIRATPFLGVDTVLNTRAQERGAADFQRRSGGVRPGELYRASDVNSNGVAKPGAKMQLGAIEAAARGKTATKDSKSDLETQTPSAPAKPVERKVISDKGGVNQKVTTNTAYKAKLGGREVTSTRGAGGQKMIRANLGRNSVQVKAGKAQAGKSYAATLGGVKGTIKYDTKGGKTFQALQPAGAQKPGYGKG